jgi:flagellar basal-body rod protein FlgB
MTSLMDSTGLVLQGALAGLSAREQLIASNVANIDTPGYIPQSVDFESTLQAQLSDTGNGASGAFAGMAAPSSGPSAAVAMTTTSPAHIAGPVSATRRSDVATQAFAGSLRNDGNRVDLDSEMTALAETQLRYSGVARLMTTRLDMLRDAAGGQVR